MPALLRKFSAVLLNFCQAYVSHQGYFRSIPTTKDLEFSGGEIGSSKWILWGDWDLARDDEEMKFPWCSQFVIPSLLKHLLPWVLRPTHFLSFLPPPRPHFLTHPSARPSSFQPEMLQGPTAQPQMSSVFTHSNPVPSTHQYRYCHISFFFF